jgi:hypothetical protein
VELTTLDEFRRRRAAGQGVFVIVGRPSGRVLVHDVSCPFMTDDAFRAKVLRRGGRKGRYVWAANAEAAIDAYGAVVAGTRQTPSDPRAGGAMSQASGTSIRRVSSPLRPITDGRGRAGIVRRT